MAHSDIEYPGWRFRLWPRRKAEAPEGLASVLAPYRPLSRSWLKRILGLSGLMLFCLIYGFFFSVFVPTYFAFFTFPVLILALLVIWALPDANWAPTRALEWLFYATFISLIVWPDYLAIALPGLPWITLLRLTSFPLLLVLLICLSISADFRSTLTRSLRAIPAIPILLCIFVVIQLYSIGLSSDISASIQKFIVAQTTWTAVFFVSAYVFLRPGQIRRWATILWAMAVFVSLIAVWEFRIERLPWVGHIPGFLQVNDEAVQRILAGSMRAGTDRYRTQATFTTSLGLAEYLTLTLPFVLHFATRQFSQRIRAAALVSIPLLLYAVYLTDAKLGSVGSLAAILLYVFVAAFRKWRRDNHSLVAASVLFGYPAGLGMLVALMLASHRFQVLIFGNDGSHDNSTNARIDQYTMGFQKILQWPFGYGIGQGASTLGFGKEISGMITIDTYYLSVVLEYGIAGFIVYFGMIAIAIYEAGRRGLFDVSDNEDRGFLLPITISLVTFIIIKSVFSQQDNHPVVFMMLGALMALAASHRKVSADRQLHRSKALGRRTPYLQHS
jgi:hypothetical protein